MLDTEELARRVAVLNTLLQNPNHENMAWQMDFEYQLEELRKLLASKEEN